MSRDYRRERKLYYGYGPISVVTPTQQKHRREMRARQIAREKLKKIQKVKSTQDVHHINGKPLDNRLSNLQATSKAYNRSKNKQ
jgi:hypothetical protein